MNTCSRCGQQITVSREYEADDEAGSFASDHECPKDYAQCEGCKERFLKEDLEDGLCPTCWEESAESEFEKGNFRAEDISRNC